MIAPVTWSTSRVSTFPTRRCACGLPRKACDYALTHHVERLSEDHARAERLAKELRGLPGLNVSGQHTNMVFIEVPVQRLPAFKTYMHDAGIRMSIGYLPSIRMVTHLDIDDDGIERTAAAFRGFFV